MSEKRITFRISEELYAQIEEHVAAVKAKDPTYTKNEFCKMALGEMSNPNHTILVDGKWVQIGMSAWMDRARKAKGRCQQ